MRRKDVRKARREAEAEIKAKYDEMVKARKLDKVENVITQEVFHNVEEAAKYYNVKVKVIQKVLDGKRKYAGKDLESGERYEWRYIEDDAMVWNKKYIEDDWYNNYMAM